MAAIGRRLGSIVGAVVIAGVASVTVGAGPALADPAPSCVQVSSSSAGSGYTRYTITNKCSTGQDVKVIVSFNPDIGCTYYARGQSRSYTYSSPSKVDRLESC